MRLRCGRVGKLSSVPKDIQQTSKNNFCEIDKARPTLPLSRFVSLFSLGTCDLLFYVQHTLQKGTGTRNYEFFMATLLLRERWQWNYELYNYIDHVCKK